MIEVVVRVAKEEAFQVIVRYKVSMGFEDEVNKAVCNAFYKSFNKCKRNVTQAFHHPDLKNIIIDKLEKIERGMDVVAQDEPAEAGVVAEPKTDPDPF